MRYFLYFLSIFIILIFGGCEKAKKGFNDKGAQNSSNNSTIKNPKMVEHITLHSVDGDDINLVKKGEDIKVEGNDKKIILFNFFATWCPPCKAEIPHLVNLQKRYKKNLKVISILLEDDKPDDEVKSFKRFNHINFTITNGGSNFKFSNILGGVSKIPFMILYDKDGKKVTTYLGAIPEEMLESDIKRVIGK